MRVLLSWLWRVTDWHSCALFRNVAASKWLALAWVFFGGCWRNKGEMDYKRIVSKFPKFLYGKNFRAQFNPASSSSPARKIFLQGTFSIRWERESQKFERNFDSKMPLQAQPHPVYKEDFRVGNFLELLTGSLKLALALRLPSVVHVSHGHALLTTHSENLPPNIPLWLNQGSCVFTFLHSITFLRENISTLGGERYPLQNGNSWKTNRVWLNYIRIFFTSRFVSMCYHGFTREDVSREVWDSGKPEHAFPYVERLLPGIRNQSDERGVRGP